MSQFAEGMKSGLDSETLGYLGEVCDLSPSEMDAAIKVFMLYSSEPSRPALENLSMYPARSVSEKILSQPSAGRNGLYQALVYMVRISSQGLS